MKRPASRPRSPPAAFIFSSFDGSGGAGVIADCRAVSACGALPLAVLCGIAPQNLDGVREFWRMPGARVRSQFDAIKTAPARAVKVGVIGSAASVVADCIRELQGRGGEPTPVVWDPVMSPTGGEPFAGARAMRRMLQLFSRYPLFVTPNRSELAAISGLSDPAAGARALLDGGAQFVLSTDVAGDGEVLHEMYAIGRARPVWSARCARRQGEYHGGGCLLSAALAARLAAGDPPVRAAAAAHRKTLAAIDGAATIPALGRQLLPQIR